MTDSDETSKVDVIVVGGGPIGTLIALQLARFGCVPYIIEQEEKSHMLTYGRACTLWPRTVELLDQLSLTEDMLQQGITTTNSFHFREGKNVKGGLMYASRMDRLGDTHHKYAFHLRQRLIEEHFSSALEELGHRVHMLQQLRSYTIDEDPKDGYPITATISKVDSGKLIQVKAKFLIGADGGKSTIRKLSGIPFVGDCSAYQWVRMDARLLSTTVPHPRSLNSIDSPTHGQILWCPIDHGYTRIGYVFSDELMKKYGGTQGFTKEVAMYEAEQAIKPFKVEWESVDWFVLYGIGQCIAESFFAQGRVFLAGDACHTHSSGSAQGLNTGIHDAVNLSWKLALHIRGLANRSIIATYEAERRPIVEQVIDNDRTISKLISGFYPSKFEGRKEHPRDILTEWFSDLSMQAFTLGLGISYQNSSLNMARLDASSSSTCSINPGERGPDVHLTKIGTGDPIRLHTILKNHGKFHIVLFAGDPTSTRSKLEFLHAIYKGDTDNGAPSNPNLNPPAKQQWHKNSQLFTWTTISARIGTGTYELFGIDYKSWIGGQVYFDLENKAHGIYGIDPRQGGMVVFRPDGWVSAIMGLEVEEMEALERWFEGLFSSG